MPAHGRCAPPADGSGGHSGCRRVGRPTRRSPAACLAPARRRPTSPSRPQRAPAPLRLRSLLPRRAGARAARRTADRGVHAQPAGAARRPALPGACRPGRCRAPSCSPGAARWAPRPAGAARAGDAGRGRRPDARGAREPAGRHRGPVALRAAGVVQPRRDAGCRRPRRPAARHLPRDVVRRRPGVLERRHDERALRGPGARLDDLRARPRAGRGGAGGARLAAPPRRAGPAVRQRTPARCHVPDLGRPHLGGLPGVRGVAPVLDLRRPPGALLGHGLPPRSHPHLAELGGRDRAHLVLDRPRGSRRLRPLRACGPQLGSAVQRLRGRFPARRTCP